MTFSVTRWFHGISHFKRKNIIKKYKKIITYSRLFSISHSSYLGGTSTRWVFKFCLCNQSAEKGSHFTLLQFTRCRNRKRKKLPHSGTRRYLRNYSHLLKKFLKKTSLHAVSVSAKRLCVQNYALKRKATSKSSYL